MGQTEAEWLESLFSREEKMNICEEIGALEVQKEIYRDWREKESRIKQQNELISQYKDDSRPIVYVEGGSDKKILEVAWEKIKEGITVPFIIHACEGAQSVQALLKNKGLLAHGRTMIGLWDCDQQGYSEFLGLIRSKKKMKFKKVSLIEVKQSGKPLIVGLILPTPPDRSSYTNLESENSQLQFLSIEHYFSNEVLMASKIISTEIDGRFFLKDKAKKKFAEKVVPNLPSKEFTNFHLVFDEIERLIR